MLISLIGLAVAVCSEPKASSIPVDTAFKMYEGKDEAALRGDAMEKMRAIVAAYQGTALAKEAERALNADEGRIDPHAWMEDSLGVVTKALRFYPPTEANYTARRDALELLDCVLHVDTGDEYHAALRRFQHPFLSDAMREIRHSRVTEGVRIWHLYNMGFIVKTSKHVVAFDVYPGSAFAGWEWMTFLTSAEARELAGIVDMAFVTHWHDDHASMTFLKAMSDAGKPVIVPAPIEPLYKPEVVGLRGIIPVREAHENPLSPVEGITVYSYPGLQGNLPCNVYVVDIDGCVVCQNGDNTAYSLYSDVVRQHRIDIALVNCWSGMNECIGGIEPGLVITGHENELGHDVFHRIAYTFTYANLDRLSSIGIAKKGRPVVVLLSWGEDLTWSPRR